MATANEKTVRADAARNHERLVGAALQAFSSGRENVTLEAIAKQAGVGIGTLYRHFPTREALVEAAYRNELEQLRTSVDDLLASHEPDLALRTWMDRFADYVAAKRGMADALRAVVASGAIRSSDTRDTLTVAIRSLLDAGTAAGTIRNDVTAEDLLATLTGILLASGAPEDRAQAGRMLDLVMDGLRTRMR
jgi:AcrR family transcriptional regulator